MTGAVGEDAHLKGAEGVRRAKQWLEATMRVAWVWLNTDNPASRSRLVYAWPAAPHRSFSFDLGGVMRAGDLDGHQFSAEVKYYSKEHKQPEMYRRFLAQCYVALSTRRHLCDHLLWITWAPFSSSVWHEHRTPGRVRQALLEHRKLLFGDVTEAEAAALIDDDLVKELADRLWLIVISDQQEQMMPLLEWQAIIEGEIRKGKG